MPRRVRQTGNVVMGDMAGGDIVRPKQPNDKAHFSEVSDRERRIK
jgi:hypothetical protein